MASKKPAEVKSVRSAPKTAPTTASKTASNIPSKSASPVKVWTLPILVLMVGVAAAGLWFAVRESSNAPQAASSTIAPEATHETPAASDAGSKRAAGASTRAATVDAATPPEAASPNAPKPVSISGCVQGTDNGYMLRDTEGSEAPRSRSWKSGFLKRSASSVMLSDAANATHLATHVGQRVSVTGPLVDREMRVQSLRRLSATCQ